MNINMIRNRISHQTIADQAIRGLVNLTCKTGLYYNITIIQNNGDKIGCL